MVHQSFEDETIIVNLDNGAYYSLNAPGRAVWLALAGGVSAGAAAAKAAWAPGAEAAGAEPAAAAAALRFIADLEREGLIRETSEVPEAGSAQALELGVWRERPAFEKFTDMEKLILLDVIHDVDETGWPVLPNGADESAR